MQIIFEIWVAVWEKGKLLLFLEGSQERTNRTESEQSLGFTFTGVKLTWVSSSGPVAGLRCRQGTGHPVGTWPGELVTLYYFLLLIELCPTYSSQEWIKEDHFCEAKWVFCRINKTRKIFFWIIQFSCMVRKPLMFSESYWKICIIHFLYNMNICSWIIYSCQLMKSRYNLIKTSL